LISRDKIVGVQRNHPDQKKEGRQKVKVPERFWQSIEHKSLKSHTKIDNIQCKTTDTFVDEKSQCMLRWLSLITIYIFLPESTLFL
jgi:hypothetical protein